MTTLQLNEEILKNLGILAKDEGMLKRVAKYLRKLVAEHEVDPTEMTREEFFARIEKSRKQPGKQFASVEELDQYIRSL